MDQLSVKPRNPGMEPVEKSQMKRLPSGEGSTVTQMKFWGTGGGVRAVGWSNMPGKTV